MGLVYVQGGIFDVYIYVCKCANVQMQSGLAC